MKLFNKEVAMKKHIVSNLVLAGLLVGSTGLQAQQSMFERKMREAGQSLQALNRAFQTAEANLRNKVKIDSKTWSVLKISAKALVAALLLAAGSYFVYWATKSDSSPAPTGPTHQARYSMDAMKKRFPGIDTDPTSWDYALLKQVELLPMQGEFDLVSTLTVLKEDPKRVSNAAYNAVLYWATNNNRNDIKMELIKLMSMSG